MPYTAANPATFTDDLTEVLDDATYDDEDASAGTATYTEPELSWAGPLAIGATATVTYSVTVNDPLTGDGELTNAITGPPESNCATPTGPGCTTTTPIKAFEIVKTTTSTSVVPGGDITYTVELTNTGQVSYTAGDPATFTDDLTEVLDDTGDPTGITITPDVGSASFTAPDLTWTGPLEAGATLTVSYTVTVDNPDLGDGVLINAVTGPPESTCADSDNPGCSVTLPDKDLTITKSSDATGAVLPGNTVTYSVDIENTGTVAYTAGDPATFSDDLTEVLDDAGDPANITITPDQGTASFTDPDLTWSGPLAVGQTVTVTYEVTVDDPLGGDGVLADAVTGPPESNCGDGTETDCTTTTPVRALEITKTSSPATALPGATITYTITVENTGGAPYAGADLATFEDDLSEILDDARYTGQTASVGNVSYAQPILSWEGPLDPGDTATITYTVIVDDPGTGDGVLTNAVVGPPESNCDTGAETGCVTTTPVRSLGITKSSDAAGAVLPGDTVTYSVEIENTGQVDYTAGDPATFSDDLTEVLDDAGDPANITVTPTGQGTATFADPDLTWSGPLAAGETVTVTYEVTVDDPPTGDGVLTNAVTGPPGVQLRRRHRDRLHHHDPDPLPRDREDLRRRCVRHPGPGRHLLGDGHQHGDGAVHRRRPRLVRGRPERRARQHQRPDRHHGHPHRPGHGVLRRLHAELVRPTGPRRQRHRRLHGHGRQPPDR